MRRISDVWVNKKEVPGLTRKDHARSPFLLERSLLTVGCIERQMVENQEALENPNLSPREKRLRSSEQAILERLLPQVRTAAREHLRSEDLAAAKKLRGKLQQLERLTKDTFAMVEKRLDAPRELPSEYLRDRMELRDVQRDLVSARHAVECPPSYYGPETQRVIGEIEEKLPTILPDAKVAIELAEEFMNGAEVPTVPHERALSALELAQLATGAARFLSATESVRIEDRPLASADVGAQAAQVVEALAQNRKVQVQETYGGATKTYESQRQLLEELIIRADSKLTSERRYKKPTVKI